jgi:demethylmenaquinone methyltransferase/2-methoxy-6-polyprenyl-1,4-benzoquinol methylase
MHLIFGDWRVSVERLPPTSAELAAMYDRAALRWQAIIERWGYDRAYADLFACLHHAGVLRGLSHGGRVLDAGIGTGALSLALAQTLAAPLHIDGVDIAPQMLAEARRVLAAAGVAARLQQHDICSLPFADGSFDLVISAHTLEHLASPMDGLRELVRVLRPGAPLVLVVTRPGPLAGLLNLRWGNHALSNDDLAALLHIGGLTHRYPVAFAGGWARWSSTVCVGFKPTASQGNSNEGEVRFPSSGEVQV